MHDVIAVRIMMMVLLASVLLLAAMVMIRRGCVAGRRVGWRGSFPRHSTVTFAK